MSKLPIMLKSNGYWDNYGRFRDFEVDSILVDDNASYGILQSTIAEQLSIDTSDKIVEIKYIVNDNCPPLQIIVLRCTSDIFLFGARKKTKKK